MTAVTAFSRRLTSCDPGHQAIASSKCAGHETRLGAEPVCCHRSAVAGIRGSGGPHQLPVRACSTQRGRPWPRSRASSTAEATRAIGPRRRTRPRQIEADRPGPVAVRTCADVAHVGVESHPDPCVAQSPLRVVIEANTAYVHHPCVESQSAQDLGQRPLYWVQNPRRRQNAVFGCSQTCSTEYVVNLSCTSREAWPARSHPAALLLRHVDTAPAKAALRHGSIVLRPPGPTKAHAHKHIRARIIVRGHGRVNQEPGSAPNERIGHTSVRICASDRYPGGTRTCAHGSGECCCMHP